MQKPPRPPFPIGVDREVTRHRSGGSPHDANQKRGGETMQTPTAHHGSMFTETCVYGPSGFTVTMPMA
eukprot:3772732-Amphidinium_carterae.1